MDKQVFWCFCEVHEDCSECPLEPKTKVDGIKGCFEWCEKHEKKFLKMLNAEGEDESSI